MADPIPFKEANEFMAPPADVADRYTNVLELPLHRTEGDPEVLVSCWRLTVPEIEEITRTGLLWVQVLGPNHPPMAIRTSRPFITDEAE